MWNLFAKEFLYQPVDKTKETERRDVNQIGRAVRVKWHSKRKVDQVADKEHNTSSD